MKILGYADPWSVAPGESVKFMVSSQSRYKVDLVRLINGDPNPAGPGNKEERIESEIAKEYEGKVQELPLGSYITVPDHESLRGSAGFTLSAWIQPTLPAKGFQGLLSKCPADGSGGYSLVINERGELALWLGGKTRLELSSGVALRAKSWYFVAASYDPKSGRAVLFQHPYPEFAVENTRAEVQTELGGSFNASKAPFVIAAYGDSGDAGRPAGFFNGKLERPMAFSEALSAAELAKVENGSLGIGDHRLSLALDFTKDIPTNRVHDEGPNGLHGIAVNMPARGMTGHDYWDRDQDWKTSGAHAAIHFHYEDIEDALWTSDFSFTVPDNLRSGVYAAKLSSEGEIYHLSFYVRPKNRRASAKVLFLVPTNSHIAYANFRETYADTEHSRGLYHAFEDGSPVFYSSRKRPIVNMRPNVYFNILGTSGAPHQMPADLHLVDWLTEKKIDFDVAIDEDLHREGVDLLSQYAVVLTGSHPEYWSTPMYDALEGYLENGGRFMYLGGNGLIWVTSYDPARPHVIEVRRSPGRIRSAVAGERYHSTTGELGGRWQDRRRPCWKTLGIGSVAQGFDRAEPYRRQPGSFDPRASWIFEGVGADEPIGDFGLVIGGASGFEIDATDPDIGTPPHTLILATGTGFSERYELQQPSHVAGTVAAGPPNIRNDMVYLEKPNGGAVFSVGSISYCGSLAHNNYDNNVSRITENVLRRFASGEELPS